jgi:hypothetical protein
MRRIIRLFFRPAAETSLRPWSLSDEQHRQLLHLLSDIGLTIVADARGPVPLLTFGRRVLEHLNKTPQIDPDAVPRFADALKHVIREMDHERLRIMSPSDFPGVGYVYNAHDPETWPVRTSR